MDEFTGYIKIYQVKNNKVSWRYHGKITKSQSWKLFQRIKDEYDCVVFYDISQNEFLKNKG